jgi:hypothetical protein
MSFRSLVYKLMAMGPLILLGSLAAQSRWYADPFEYVSCTSQQQKDISAYIDVVRASEPLENGPAKPEDIRRVASLWVQGKAEGTLRPLTPCWVDDTMRSPVKIQIKMANDAVTQKLINLARKEAESGQAWQAAQDHLLALNVDNAIKFSDPLTVMMTGTRERSILGMIRSEASVLSSTEKKRLANQIVQFTKLQVPLDDLARITATNVGREEQRLGINELASIDPEQATGVGLERKDVRPEMASWTAIQHDAYKKKIEPTTNYLGLAYESQGRLKDTADSVIAVLMPKPAA